LSKFLNKNYSLSSLNKKKISHTNNEAAVLEKLCFQWSGVFEMLIKLTLSCISMD